MMIGKTLLIGSISSLLGAACLDYVLSNHYFRIETIREDTTREQVMKSLASLNLPKKEELQHHTVMNVSLLEQYESKYGDELVILDHYRTLFSIPKDSNKKDSELTCTEMAQSFYTSPLFGLEKMVLKRMEPSYGNLENSIIETLNFDIGDNVSMFKVIEKRENELLLRTPWGSLSWMKVVKKSETEYELNFGSGILTKGLLGSKPEFRVLIPFHAIYSRYLLAFTKVGLSNKRK